MVEVGIMPAIDMHLGKAIQFFAKLEGVEEGITALKIGYKIIERYGTIISRKLFDDIELSLPICYDPQKRGTDVPFIVKGQVEDIDELKPKFYIGSPLGSGSNLDDSEKPGTLETFVNACSNNGIIPIIVVEMTQPGATRYSSKEKCEQLAKDCVELGVKYIVAPATKPERLMVYRKIFDGEVNVVSPGSGPQKTGNVLVDAVTAIEKGADHLVIGRGIYQSKNPIQTIKDVYAAIKTAHEERVF